MSHNKVLHYIAITLIFSVVIGITPSITLAATKKTTPQTTQKKLPNIFSATIEQVDGNTLIVQNTSTQKKSKVIVNRSTRYSGKEKITAPKQLKVGSKIIVRGTYDEKKDVFTAQTINVLNTDLTPISNKAGVSGILETVGTTTVSVRTTGNIIVVFNTKKTRVITTDNKNGSLSNLKVGDKVTVVSRTEKNSSNPTATLIRQSSR